MCTRLCQATSRCNGVHMQVQIGVGEGGGATFKFGGMGVLRIGL